MSNKAVFFYLASVLASINLHANEANLRSSVPSTVEGVTLPNTHLVDSGRGKIYRGMRPFDKASVEELLKIGITDFLHFRESNSVIDFKDEKKLLEEAKVPSTRIHYIPFKWKNIENFQTACEQTLQALELFYQIKNTKDRALFVHCTVGEDRTGYLAGLYRILYQHWRVERTFKNELCHYGYADGASDKPAKVSEAIHQNLTPLFFKMAYLIEKHKLRPTAKLNYDACKIDPEANPKFIKKYSKKIEKIKCVIDRKNDRTLAK